MAGPAAAAGFQAALVSFVTENRLPRLGGWLIRLEWRDGKPPRDHGIGAVGGWRGKSETGEAPDQASRLVIEWTADLPTGRAGRRTPP